MAAKAKSVGRFEVYEPKPSEFPNEAGLMERQQALVRAVYTLKRFVKEYGDLVRTQFLDNPTMLRLVDEQIATATIQAEIASLAINGCDPLVAQQSLDELTEQVRAKYA